MRNGDRQQTLERARHHRGFVVLETGGGFFGDRFVTDLLDRLTSDLGPNSSVVDLTDPDETDTNLDPDVGLIRAPLVSGLRGWRDTVAGRHAAGKPTVIALPPGVPADIFARESVPAMLVDTASLTMGSSDVQALMTTEPGEASTGMAEIITQLGDGWPAWVTACLSLLASSSPAEAASAISAFGSPSFRRRIVEGHLKPFSARDVIAMAQLAHFDTFSDDAAAAIGGIEFAETVLPYAPGLLRTPAGLQRFVSPVRNHLIATHPLDPVAAETVAPVLAGDGELIVAVDALLAANLASTAASLLEALPGSVLDRTNQRELLALFRVINAHVPGRPALNLKQARVHGNLAETVESVQVCEQVLEMAPPNSKFWLEAAVENMYHRHRTINQAEAAEQIAILRQSMAESTTIDPTAGTRLREIEAAIMGQSPDPATVQRAADLFIEVAAEWEHQQENLRSARALRAAAGGPLHHLGRYREAQLLLERAARLAIEQTFDFGVTLCVKARFDALCGDRDAFRQSWRQARFAIEGSRIDWLSGQLHLAIAIDAAWDKDRHEVDRCFRAAKHLFGPTYQTDNGVLLHCDAAVLLSMTGDLASAQQVLDEARDRSALNRTEFAIAEVIVAARSGDIGLAKERWCELDAEQSVPNDRRWRLLLELENAAQAPDPEVVAVICHDAERLNLTSLLPMISPRLFNQQNHQLKQIRAEVLGPFRLLVDQVPTKLPEGRVSDLVKLLLISGGTTTLDVAIDHLWPNASLEVGARRLRNVVNRVRNELGPESIVRTDEQLILGGNVTSDLAEFNKAVQDSLANRRHNDAAARQAAIAALDLYRGALLPRDLYSDQVAQRRHSIARVAQELLDYLVEEHHPNSAWVSAARARLSTENEKVDGL